MTAGSAASFTSRHFPRGSPSLLARPSRPHTCARKTHVQPMPSHARRRLILCDSTAPLNPCWTSIRRMTNHNSSPPYVISRQAGRSDIGPDRPFCLQVRYLAKGRVGKVRRTHLTSTMNRAKAIARHREHCCSTARPGSESQVRFRHSVPCRGSEAFVTLSSASTRSRSSGHAPVTVPGAAVQLVRTSPR